MKKLLCWLFLLAIVLQSGAAQPAKEDLLLFDFEDPADVKVWSNLELPKDREPPIKLELSAEHATSGKHSLKLTFAGGRWPTITTTNIQGEWLPYKSFQADVTVSRPCLALRTFVARFAGLVSRLAPVRMARNCILT